MNDAPVNLRDKKGGYATFIEDEVIPKILSVIEESGLSYCDAQKVPALLGLAIESAGRRALLTSRFKVIES